MQIISRKDAKALNLKRYFTGEPCKHGHIAERFTSNGECIPCAVESRNRPERKQKAKEYRDRNKHKNRERASKYYKDNIESVKIKRAEYSRRYKLENREEILRKSKEYRDRNREKIALKKKEKRGTRNIKSREKYRSDINFKVQVKMREMVSRLVRRTDFEKRTSTNKTLGYTVKQLRDHLESKFEEGMSWDNHGEWHIDHIIPLTVMVEMGITDPSVVNGLDNLQPLWASENLSKGNRHVG